MELSNDLKLKISIILPAMLGYDSVLAALDSWEAQHCRDQLEILACAPLGLIIRYRRVMLSWKLDQCCFTKQGQSACEKPQRTS